MSLRNTDSVIGSGDFDEVAVLVGALYFVEMLYFYLA